MNDYCGVYAGSTTVFVPAGPIWLGYYRSQDGSRTFQSSLVPGYPGDTSPYGALAQIRTSSSGDPVIAWDGHERVFMGSESSGDPAGTKKTFGDEWVATFDNPHGDTGATIDDGQYSRLAHWNRGTTVTVPQDGTYARRRIQVSSECSWWNPGTSRAVMISKFRSCCTNGIRTSPRMATSISGYSR